jgi:hypothetical protein
MYNYKNILKNLAEETVSLYFPKFEINYKYELDSIFQSLGMKKAFTEEADFSLISNDEDMKIDKIIHKAYIKLDEEGTEASAATAVKYGRKTKLIEKTPVMVVDHPFLFIIRNENLPAGHDILFICVIEDFKDIKSEKNIKDTDTGINNPQSQQINNKINNNINLLEFDYDDKPNNNNNNNIDLLGDIFQSSNYNVMNSNFNNNNNLMNQSENKDLIQFNDNIQDLNFSNNGNNSYNMNISSQTGNFNIEEVNKNVEKFKKDTQKSNDPFNFIDDLMKKK